MLPITDDNFIGKVWEDYCLHNGVSFDWSDEIYRAIKHARVYNKFSTSDIYLLRQMGRLRKGTSKEFHTNFSYTLWKHWIDYLRVYLVKQERKGKRDE